MTILEYLEREAETPKGWLKRSPKTTDPAIYALYVEYVETGKYPYLDDVCRFITERTPELPPFDNRKGSNEQPNPIQRQLSAEVYVSSRIYRDAQNAERLAGFEADGFQPAGAVDVTPGGVYLLARATHYSGADVVTLADPVKVRPVFEGETLRGFLPPRKRTHGYSFSSLDYLKPATC